MATPRLNRPQAEAVAYRGGPLLVLAGAGSGKTGVITAKIAALIAAGTAAETIAAVTFTNKAAREMKQRVAAQVRRSAAAGLTVSTFHALGLSIVRAEARALGYRPGFTIFDAEDSDKLLADLVAGDADTRRRARAAISAWKAELIEPEAAAAAAADDSQRAFARAYADYERRLKAYNALDFDDLLKRPVMHLRADAPARERWQNRFRYLLVDEFQDTNAAQYELLGLLVGARGALTAVGDDDQSIYGWRGAQPGHMTRLASDYPHLKVIKLEQNFRSVNAVLSAANTLIAAGERTFEKNLWSAKGRGDPVRVLACADEAAEAERVVAEIGAHRLRHGNRYGDYAILYRGNYQSRVFEKTLRERGIAYRVSGGRSFFERGEIRDLVAYLRLLVNPDDDSAFLRIVNLPRREIGAATLETLARYAGRGQRSLLEAARGIGLAGGVGERSGRRLAEFADWIGELARAAQSQPARAVTARVVDESGYRDWLRETATNTRAARSRLANVDEFLGWLAGLDADSPGEACGLETVVRRLTLMDLASANETQRDDQVQLLTLHAAKGLEFDHVYLAGLEEELLPHHACRDDDARLAEERRLLYVGITRAGKSLTLTYARQRRRGGDASATTPSRFLEELPAAELEWPQSRGRPAEPASAEQSAARVADLRALLDQGAV